MNFKNIPVYFILGGKNWRKINMEIAHLYSADGHRAASGRSSRSVVDDRFPQRRVGDARISDSRGRSTPTLLLTLHHLSTFE